MDPIAKSNALTDLAACIGDNFPLSWNGLPMPHPISHHIASATPTARIISHPSQHRLQTRAFSASGCFGRFSSIWTFHGNTAGASDSRRRTASLLRKIARRAYCSRWTRVHHQSCW